jgi:predicted ATPase
MISALHIAGYRSLKDIAFELGPLTVVTGPNGAGKSNVFRALALLKSAALGRFSEALAQEGGMPAVLFAGPETLDRERARAGIVEGGPRQHRNQLLLGIAFDDFRYELVVGLPPQAPGDPDPFVQDPDVKNEAIWSGKRRPSSILVHRKAGVVSDGNAAVRSPRPVLEPNESLLWQLSDAARFPEVAAMRARLSRLRLHHGFATEANGPARQVSVGFRSPVLADDGANLAAALATIAYLGNGDALDEAIDLAFPGARVRIKRDDEGRFVLRWHQHGLLRPLGVAELSDGTLRYLCLLAALHSPRPPEVLAINEPELSLYPELLRPLASQFRRAAKQMQVIVVSHAESLINSLEDSGEATSVFLTREFGATVVQGQTLLARPEV